MKDEYFVLFGSDDGEPSLHQMSKKEILELFNPNRDGEYEYGHRTALAQLPEDLDLQGNFGDDSMIIIKGEIVVPKSIKVVTQYELP
jgi:hypothetical protein